MGTVYTAGISVTKLPKKEVDKHLHQIYRALAVAGKSTPKFRLNSAMCYFGLTTWLDNGTITVEINHRRRSPIMRTIIHECLHLTYADMSELNVLKLESILFENLTDQQHTNLLKKTVALM